jgi:hypothetical protein
MPSFVAGWKPTQMPTAGWEVTVDIPPPGYNHTRIGKWWRGGEDDGDVLEVNVGIADQ